MNFWLQFLRSQFFAKIPEANWDFSGQTVIITGSNTGLGLEAARHITRLGAAKVILAVRTVSKGEAAARSILQSTKSTKEDVVEVWPLDLSDYESVKAFGARVQGLERLDAVIQNAGIFTTKFKIVEGNESHVTVNVVSAVLVGLLALPKLRETARKYGVRTRLAFNGSDMQFVAKFREANAEGSLLEALNQEEKADMGDRYGVSKLLLLYSVRELAARSPITPDSNVVITYLTPGLCHSDLLSRGEINGAVKLIEAIFMKLVARTTELGSRMLVHAVKPDIEEASHGKFLMDTLIVPNGSNVDSAQGQANQKRWATELFPLLEKIAPGCTKILS